MLKHVQPEWKSVNWNESKKKTPILSTRMLLWQHAHTDFWQFQIYQWDNILLRQLGTKGNSVCTHLVQIQSSRPSKTQISASPAIILFKPTALSKQEMRLLR